MKKWISLLLCLTLVAALLSACGSGHTDPQKTPDPETAQPVEEPVAVFSIETPYATFAYPERWKDKLTVGITEDPYTLHFSAGEEALFDLIINGEEGYFLGTLQAENGDATLHIISYDLDNQRADYADCRAMQEDVNVLLQHLRKDYTFREGEIPEEGNDSVYAIETDVVTLYYPERWKEQVTVDVTADAARFSCDGVQLFDILFGGEEGILLGTYAETPIRVVSYAIEQGELSDSRYEQLGNMEEDINVLIQHLMEDSAFRSGED